MIDREPGQNHVKEIILGTAPLLRFVTSGQFSVRVSEWPEGSRNDFRDLNQEIQESGKSNILKEGIGWHVNKWKDMRGENHPLHEGELRNIFMTLVFVGYEIKDRDMVAMFADELIDFSEQTGLVDNDRIQNYEQHTRAQSSIIDAVQFGTSLHGTVAFRTAPPGENMSDHEDFKLRAKPFVDFIENLDMSGIEVSEKTK